MEANAWYLAQDLGSKGTPEDERISGRLTECCLMAGSISSRTCPGSTELTLIMPFHDISMGLSLIKGEGMPRISVFRLMNAQISTVFMTQGALTDGQEFR